MEIQQMREKIADVYPGPRWKWKVSVMEDDQVMAIYFSFLEKGVFEGKREIKSLKDAPRIIQQLSIDDLDEEDDDEEEFEEEEVLHKDILKRFIGIYPIGGDDIECWYPNGKGSIRIKSKAYGEFIFTYKTKHNWKIETVDSYLDSIRVEV